MFERDVGRATTRALIAVFTIVAAMVIIGGARPAFTGTSLPAKLKYVKGPTTSIPADGETYKMSGAICPLGWDVVGGGVIGSSLFRVVDEYPTGPNGSAGGRRGWTADVVNTFGGGGAADGHAMAICVKGATTSGTWP